MILPRQKLYAELKDVGGDENKLKEIQDRQQKAQERKEFKAKKKANREASRYRASGQRGHGGARSANHARINDRKFWENLIGQTGHNSPNKYLNAEELETGATRKYTRGITYPGLNQNITTKGELGYILGGPNGDIKIETPRDFYEHEVKSNQTYVKSLKRQDR